MNEFLNAAFGFPTALFTAALVVIVGFWLLVAVGAAESDGFEGDLGLGRVGLGGVPVAVAVSVFVAVAWCGSLIGSVLLRRAGFEGPGYGGLAAAVLVLAVLLARSVVRALVRPLSRLMPDEPGPSRLDFIGQTCVVRTGRVDAAFGQAEVTARDGSSALVQVRRQSTDGPLALGSTGLLYAYDEDGEFFWVSPYEA
ncbi:hypothetical protein [Streptomyces sp. NPDC002851]